jgi:hypothetical protein
VAVEQDLITLEAAEVEDIENLQALLLVVIQYHLKQVDQLYR